MFSAQSRVVPFTVKSGTLTTEARPEKKDLSVFCVSVSSASRSSLMTKALNMEPIKLLHTADIHIGMENYGRIDPATGINGASWTSCAG